VHELCQDLERVADMIAESPAVRVVERDPNDDMVIACAVEGRVDYVVTRDKDLLSLGAYRASGWSRRASCSICWRDRAPDSALRFLARSLPFGPRWGRAD
jgi:predicted nucleic acid-binding protein